MTKLNREQLHAIFTHLGRKRSSKAPKTSSPIDCLGNPRPAVVGRFRKKPEVPSGRSSRLCGLRPVTVSLRPLVGPNPNDRSGRSPGRHQIHMSGSLLISKPASPLKTSPGKCGSEAGILSFRPSRVVVPRKLIHHLNVSVVDARQAIGDARESPIVSRAMARSRSTGCHSEISRLVALAPQGSPGSF